MNLPTEYLLILMGIIGGFPLGFAAASLLAARRMRGITAREWREARKFYIKETDPFHTQPFHRN